MVPRLLFFIFSFFLVLFLFSTSGYTSGNDKYVKDGKQYGVTKGIFRNKWWNYYERGLSFAEGGFWTEAEKDLRRALKKRSKDKRYARTYGMHRVEYFANRELGIVLYQQQKYDDALKLLELSLGQEDSSKAKFFINSTKLTIIKNSGLDTALPVIKITSPFKTLLTNKTKISVKGEATDDQLVAAITINDKPIFIELYDKKIQFNKEVSLKPGSNIVTIKIKDVAGKSTKKQFTVLVDRQGPVINIEEVASLENGKFHIKGAIFDDTGIKEVSIGDQTLNAGREKVLEFSQTITTRVASLDIVAKDILENETFGKINLEEILKTTETNHKLPLLAFNTPYPAPLAGYGSDVISDAVPNFLLLSTAETGNPLIKIYDLEEDMAVFEDTYFLEGAVTDGDKVASITVNGIPVTEHQGIKVFFNYLAELKEGENVFTVIATDAKQNVSKKVIKIVRKINKAFNVGSRLSMALLPLAEKGETVEISPLVFDLLLQSLSERKRFNLLARGPGELEAVLQELKLSSSALADKEKALKIGRLLTADITVSGTILETAKAVNITVRLIDTETSEIIATTDVYGEDKRLQTLKYLLTGLALKIQGKYPLLSGMIIKVEGNTLYCDIGLQNKITNRMKFIAYKKGENFTHPVTGKIYAGDTNLLAELEVVKVYDDFSKMKIRNKIENVPLAPMNSIISK